MLSAPEAIIASRSKPRAMPADGGMPKASAARKSSSSGQSGPDSRVAPRPIGLEARALLVGVGQFDEGIGQFDAADEQLEPLGDARIGRIAARQRGLRGGPVGQEGGMRAAEPRLDPLEQEAEEQVLPVLVLAQRVPAAAASAGASSAVASTSAPT